MGIPLALVIGDSELQRGLVKLRNMATKEEVCEGDPIDFEITPSARTTCGLLSYIEGGRKIKGYLLKCHGLRTERR